MSCQNFFKLTEEEIRKIVRNNAKIYEGMLLNYDEPLFPFADNYLNKIIREELSELEPLVMRQLQHDFQVKFYEEVLSKIRSKKSTRDHIKERKEIQLQPSKIFTCKPSAPIKPARKNKCNK